MLVDNCRRLGGSGRAGRDGSARNPRLLGGRGRDQRPPVSRRGARPGLGSPLSPTGAAGLAARLVSAASKVSCACFGGWRTAPAAAHPGTSPRPRPPPGQWPLRGRAPSGAGRTDRLGDFHQVLRPAVHADRRLAWQRQRGGGSVDLQRYASADWRPWPSSRCSPRPWIAGSRSGWRRLRFSDHFGRNRVVALAGQVGAEFALPPVSRWSMVRERRCLARLSQLEGLGSDFGVVKGKKMSRRNGRFFRTACSGDQVSFLDFALV